MVRRISSKSEAFGSRGTFLLFAGEKKTVQGIDQGLSVLVGQFPWGPDGEVTDFVNNATFRAQFAPPGFDRTGASYLMATRFAWSSLKIIRVVSSTASKASKAIQNSTPVDCLTLTAKYKGSAGNSIAVVIAAATNAVSTSFNMTISMTNSSTGKVTSELYENVDSTQTSAAYYTALIADSLLVGTCVKNASGRPVNGSYTLTGATDGTVASSDYVGTEGSADKGFALLETDPDVDFVFTDDPGSGLLSAVNSGGKAHAVYMGDARVYVGQGLAAEALSTAKTNAAAISSDHVMYVWGHGKVLDDEGTERTIPYTGGCVCMWSKLPPHLSGAIKRSQFTRFMAPYKSVDVSSQVEANRKDAEKNFITCVEKNKDNVISPYCAVMTDGTPMYVTRMKDYIGFSVAAAIEELRSDPNIAPTINSEISLVEDFLQSLKDNLTRDYINDVIIVDFEVLSLDESNTQTAIDAGDASIIFNVKLASEQKRAFLIGTIGTSVKIDAQVIA